MPLYEFSQGSIVALSQTTFGTAGLHERKDLQRLLREHIEVISPDTLVIAEEFGDWEDSRRRIDLLGIDKDANLVVIELKRTEDGGHTDLQAIRYASMVSTMTFDQAVGVYEQYLKNSQLSDIDARTAILDFLEWDEPDEDQFAQDVRIVLASGEFSKELASSVLWLIDHELDVRCIRMKAYAHANSLLVDVQQIIPLPEAADYQFQVREKSRKERQARVTNADFTRFNVEIGGEKQVSMWKRNAIYFVCRHLCQHGAHPDSLLKLMNWRASRLWYSVDGNVDGPEFEKLATAKAAAGGPIFRPRRWFCDSDELVHVDSKTYALSNQWGGPTWHRAMNLLKDKYPEFKIDFAPTSGSG
jgi:hypothetical protein